MIVGLDIGSTTIKCVVLDESNHIIYSHYDRHLSLVTQETAKLLEHIHANITKGREVKLMVSGSAGMGMADRCSLPFIQEVYATRIAAKQFAPETDVIIELGGEDAKILFLTNQMEVRMNGSCAGGTGAFIDQMASLLDVSLSELDQLASSAEKVYTIASRCGVFAKSDIQPLMNQGARKSDIALSIFHAVVNQTIAGLAQGRPIKGDVLYLGGPMTFLDNLRASFDEILDLTGVCPKNSLYFVALGAALSATTPIDIPRAVELLTDPHASIPVISIPPLFTSQQEYDAFTARHASKTVPFASYTKEGVYFLGIDAGSTTVKSVLMNQDKEIVHTTYQSNSGNPITIIKEILENLYHLFPSLVIRSSAVTGYGEEITQAAFGIDHGVVETVAHFTSAKHFMRDVEFVIDIGGQDIKCFQIHNGVIDNIFLNEACSSGCGSFLQTFASALGYSVEEFAQMGLFAPYPVDLGSRCTVFMNSSIKQAQREGSSVEDMSAGLSMSVVKNAIYKVIRAASSDSLGKNIVVQGGTFLNDSVLRAFEKELNVEVVRPTISGLMGAYGAALHAQEHQNKSSTTATQDELAHFSHTVRQAVCRLCSNNCQLTINTFANNKRFISGNRCERPITKKSTSHELNIFKWKLNQLEQLGLFIDGPIESDTIAIPLGLNTYEFIYFWKAFFETLGKKVVISPLSNRELYILGQNTIPSDTVCFPAKLLHGHVQHLINRGAKTIFYPCMTYNIDEHLGDNHFNCPVVAYYPEVIGANMEDLQSINYLNFHIGVHLPKEFPKKMALHLKDLFKDTPLSQFKKASKAAYKAHEQYLEEVRKEGLRIIDQARIEGKNIMILAGRPYHVDPEVSHGIDTLIGTFGVAVISEDVLSSSSKRISTDVLNQWTYHSRLYSSAQAIADEEDIHLIQLVSFGCGVDAITSDETRDILEREQKMYTQIKIDEITNLGAVKIRLRSLLSAIEQQEASIGT
jgi:predicted CoA-substrate-specific enzyme activase